MAVGQNAETRAQGRPTGQAGPTEEDAYGQELVEDVVRLLDQLKIEKAHIVGYSMGGIIAGHLIAEHPDRVLSGALGGMGWLKSGGAGQWIEVPMIVFVGDKDRLVNRLYVEPLKQVRPDWQVIEIKDANHLSCVVREQFREELAAWLEKHSKEPSAASFMLANASHLRWPWQPA